MYLRVFHDLWESSLMAEAVPVRWLFITMLGMADRARSGIIDVPLFILARQAGMTEFETREALKKLMEPDPMSRSDKEEGRRVIPARPDQPERGWEIVNWNEYAAQIRAADRRIQIREAVQRHRAKAKEGQPASAATLDGQPESGDVSDVSDVNNGNHLVIEKHGMGEDGMGEDGSLFSTSEEPPIGASKRTPKRFTPPTVEEVRAYAIEKGYGFDPEEFVAYYASQGWKKANGRLLADWKLACVTWQKKREPAPAAAPATPRRTLKEISDLAEAEQKR